MYCTFLVGKEDNKCFFCQIYNLQEIFASNKKTYRNWASLFRNASILCSYIFLVLGRCQGMECISIQIFGWLFMDNFKMIDLYKEIYFVS